MELAKERNLPKKVDIGNTEILARPLKENPKIV
jgi:hypothetical protein